MLTRLWSFLTGYVSLVVEGKRMEKLINMAVSRGLYLWDVRWLDGDRISAKVRVSGIKALRHIAKRTGTCFKITGKGGLPFAVAQVRKKKMLVAGVVLSVLLVYMMSSFIWFLDVKGNKVISRERILITAEHAGLAMGTFKMGLDKDRIEKYIRNEIPETSWVGIRITGTKAVIEIAEKVIPPPVDNSPANVVADKAGLIDEILVLNGKALVSEGQMVKPGDVLISGVIKPEAKQPDEEDPENPDELRPRGPVKLVRARGIVRVRVWYEGYGEGQLVETGAKRTGRQAEVLSIRMLGREFILRGPETPPYKEFVTGVEVKNLLSWRNIRLPVEVVTTDYYEIKKYRDIIGLSGAKDTAYNRALAAARVKIPAAAKTVREIAEEIPARGSNVIRVKVVLEVLEDIGREAPLKPDESG